MKKVLVTGGAGFIGSHLVEGLIAKGYSVRVLDNLVYGFREWVHPDAEFIEGDICDFETCKKATEGMEGVFHCAAMSRSGPSLDAIDTCTQVNIVGTQNVLMAARDNGVGKLIYSGSSTYYGSQPAPHHEDRTPPDFLNFYGLSKHVGSEYALMFDRVFDFPVVALRYFNVYGPRQPRVGAYALVLGIFLQKWAEGSQLEIHGDGLQRRDFIHVRDVVSANIMSYESSQRSVVFNVGSGTNISILELADMITTDEKLFTPRRKADAEVTLADIERITTRLGWKPEVSFEEGLKELMELAKSQQ